MDRRNFLKVAGVGAAVGTSPATTFSIFDVDQNKPKLPIFLTVAGNPPQVWIDGLEKLLTRPIPFSIPARKWQAIANGATNLANSHLSSLATFGWSTMEIFSVDRTHPEERVDQAGALYLFNNATIITIGIDKIVFVTNTGAMQTIYRKPPQAWAKSRLAMLWDI
jgi:hypothetical protein